MVMILMKINKVKLLEELKKVLWIIAQVKQKKMLDSIQIVNIVVQKKKNIEMEYKSIKDVGELISISLKGINELLDNEKGSK